MRNTHNTRKHSRNGKRADVHVVEKERNEGFVVVELDEKQQLTRSFSA